MVREAKVKLFEEAISRYNSELDIVNLLKMFRTTKFLEQVEVTDK